jgi:hypothetical protein
MSILNLSYDTLEESKMDEKTQKKSLKEAKTKRQLEKNESMES